MRIKWGFLTTLTLLCVSTVAFDLRGDEKPKEKASQPTSPNNQVPLRSDFSFGWSQPPMAAGGVQRISHDHPATAAWPGAGTGPGGYPGLPGGSMLPAFHGSPEMPQPFPGPPAGPMGPVSGPMLGGGGYGDEYTETMEAPYPSPFEGWIDGSENCPLCGGAGCDECAAVGGGILGWLITGMRPYPEGGICAPRWYDITMDAMFLTREDAGRSTAIASQGINGNTILSTGDFAFEDELGFRFTGATQITAGLIAEFTYFGLFNFADQKSVSDQTVPGDFFSVYSNFGTNPFNGFDETDRSGYQEITFSSTVDNFELNFRRRWAAPNCLFQGSWLAGVRYVYLLEDFGYHSDGGFTPAVPPITPAQVLGRQATEISTRNSLTGFQVGADIWSTVIPGISVGGELKGGVYGNNAHQRTQLFATTTAPFAQTTIIEERDINDVAFVGEARFEAIYRTGPNWTIRAGYSVFFVDGIALASENLNPGAPPSLQAVGLTPRPPFRNDNGNLLFHGGHFGVEWIW
jgi:hypothetical protein